MLLLCPAVWAQAEEDYLQSIDGEASDLNLDSQTKSQESEVHLFSSDVDPGQAGAIKELASDLSLEQFQVVLKNNYIGSFLFFQRLSEEKQLEVYQYYLQNPDPQKIREKILQVNKR